MAEIKSKQLFPIVFETFIGSGNTQVRSIVQAYFDVLYKGDDPSKQTAIKVQNPGPDTSHTQLDEAGALVVGSPYKGFLVMDGDTLYWGPTINIEDCVNIMLYLGYHQKSASELQHLCQQTLICAEYQIKAGSINITKAHEREISKLVNKTDPKEKAYTIAETTKLRDIEKLLLNEQTREQWLQAATDMVHAFINHYRITNNVED